MRARAVSVVASLTILLSPTPRPLLGQTPVSLEGVTSVEF
jgi:hypothetical protein